MSATPEGKFEIEVYHGGDCIQVRLMRLEPTFSNPISNSAPPPPTQKPRWDKSVVTQVRVDRPHWLMVKVGFTWKWAVERAVERMTAEAKARHMALCVGWQDAKDANQIVNQITNNILGDD